jgi:hypothetical protein
VFVEAGELLNFALRTCNELTHAAGFGSKTDGFRNLLDLYQELHNMGYRCDVSIKDFFNNMENKLV